MTTRSFRLWAVLALVLYISAPCVPNLFAATPRTQGIDPALLAKAEAGSAEAQHALGNKYYRGDGVRRDYSQAEFWYRKAAEKGNPDSQ
jgi:TPR repeat protein